MGRGIRNSEYFDNHEQIAMFVPCRDGGSQILNHCGIKMRQLVLSCSRSLILGIRNSKYVYNYEQITFFVPCHDSLNFIRLLRVVITEGVITTRSII